MTADPEAVFVVDDDEAVRESLCLLLQMNGYGASGYASAESFAAAWGPGLKGCVIADVRMPGTNGIDLIEQMRRHGLDLPVIIITGHGDVPMAVAALKAGALDFIEKPYQDRILIERVREALDVGSRQSLDREMVDLAQARMASLSTREREVMEFVVAGQPNKIIAAKLGISIRTVEIHRARVMEKTEARSLSELVRLSLLAEGGRAYVDAIRAQSLHGDGT